MSRTVARLAVACLLVAGVSARASAQVQPNDTALTHGVKKDRPLSAAERQIYAGTYRTELPGGVSVSLRIFDEGGSLKLWASEPDESRRMLYQGDNTFLVENTPGFVLSFDVLHDVAMKFTVRKPEGDLVAFRVR